jgi:hypothetical protein
MDGYTEGAITRGGSWPFHDDIRPMFCRMAAHGYGHEAWSSR